MLPHSEACVRNSGPIGDVLEEILAPGDLIWEIGSGTGQHSVYLARRFPQIFWQPTDRPENLDVIERRVAASECQNIQGGLRFDLFDYKPALDEADVVFAANVIHIAPWEATVRLFEHAFEALRPGGVVFLYGPFRYRHRELEPSNERFERWLKGRDPRSGVRLFEEVDESAQRVGFELVEDRAMPANNRSIWWRRRDES